jgi:hypothetical protein
VRGARHDGERQSGQECKANGAAAQDFVGHGAISLVLKSQMIAGIVCAAVSGACSIEFKL